MGRDTVLSILKTQISFAPSIRIVLRWVASGATSLCSVRSFELERCVESSLSAGVAKAAGGPGRRKREWEVHDLHTSSGSLRHGLSS
jgi:hypothetical protein